MGRLPGADPLLILAVVLVAGTALGELARRLRLPSVSGQILAGVAMGPSALALFAPGDVAELEPITHFALALIGVTVGAHLNLARLRNAGRRLALLVAAEILLIPPLVCGALLGLAPVPLIVALLLGALAVETAPASIVAVVRETRSLGVFVKTLLGAVVLDNIACIFLFELARGAGRLALGGDSLSEVAPVDVLSFSATQLGRALGVGGALALAAHGMGLRMRRPERVATLSVVALLLTYGLASYLEVSPLAAALALGAVQTNLSPARDRVVDSVFASFEPVILCLFFTLAGMHLKLTHAGAVGLVVLLVVAARAVGKITAATLAMRLAGATESLRRRLGTALLPQAGLSVGLLLLIQDDPSFREISPFFTAVVLSAVTVNELLGPVATRVALARSGEVGRDRPRLVDFLHEEHITTDLEAESMESAVGRLVELLVRSHSLRGVDKDALRRSILDREKRISTCLGEGLAVPHGELPEGQAMVGVMGLSRRGLPFDTPDGRPVHCVVLLATPAGERDRHLQVLAALARTVGANPAVRQQLYNAKSPAHAYEILAGKAVGGFDALLEERGAA